jgi:hypothetical protein
MFKIMKIRLRELVYKNKLSSKVSLTLMNVTLSLVNFSLCFSFLSNAEFGAWVVVFGVYQWMSAFDGGVGNQARNKYTLAEKSNDIALKKVLIREALQKSAIILLFMWLGWKVIDQFLDWERVFSGNIPDFLLEFIVFSALLNAWSKNVNKFLFARDLGFVTLIAPILNNLIIMIGLVFSQKLLSGSLIDGSQLIIVVGLYIFFSPILNLLILFLFFKNLLFNVPQRLLSEINYRDGLWFLCFQGFSGVSLIILPGMVAYLGSIELAGEVGILIRYYSLPLLVLTVFLQYEWRGITLRGFQEKISELSVWSKRLSIGWLLLMCTFGALFLMQSIILEIWLGEAINISKRLSISLVVFFCFFASKRFLTTVLQALGVIRRPALVSLIVPIVFSFHFLMKTEEMEVVIFSVLMSTLLEFFILVFTMKLNPPSGKFPERENT